MVNKAPDEPVGGKIELDSYADTCVFGRNFIPLHFTGKECDVSPYTDDYDSVLNVPIVTAATAFDDPESGQTYILVFNEGLWMPKSMENSLINPNQLRSFGCVVQDNPWGGSPTYIEDPSGEILVPLISEGVILSSYTRTPLENELLECPKIVMTSEVEWDPHNVKPPAPHMTAEQHRLVRDIATVQIGGESDNGFGAVEIDNEVYSINGFNERLVKSCRVTEKRRLQAIRAGEIPADVPTPKTLVSGERKSDVTAEGLAERWFIGLEAARKTLKSTTQRLVRSALLPMSRRYKADRIFRLPRLDGEWYTDTLFPDTKSHDGNTCAQIFANEDYFATIYPMDSKTKCGDALKTFCREFGIPSTLRSDQAPEMVGRKTEFQAQVRKHGINHHASEADLHNQSPAEGVVHEVKKLWYRTMFQKRVPKVFWDYGMRWVSETMSRTHLRRHKADGGGVPLQNIVGETIDISEYIDFGFYDRVWYRDNAGLGEPKLGRWLGVASNVGATMWFWVLTPTGSVVARGTVW